MPKEPTSKFYAVLHGRESPFVTSSIQKYKDATIQFSGASGKGFFSKTEAEQWLNKARGITTNGSTIDEFISECRRLTSDSLKENSREPPLTKYLDELELDKTTPDIKLSEQQHAILNLVKEGRNVFFTGPAGAGKSVLLRAIIQYLRGIMKAKHIGVTATTGIAAIAIGGRTIHSYAGIGLGNEEAEVLLDIVSSNKSAKERWLTTKVWIIDEVSMLDARLFDKLDFIGRGLRDALLPFGGIQLIVTGDFFQLPPVSKKDILGHGPPSRFTFEADSWNTCFQQPYFLEQVFRQTNTEFIDILSAVRLGKISQSQQEALLALERPLNCDAGVEPSCLYPTRKQVGKHNEDRLDMISAPLHAYQGMDSAGWCINMFSISRDDVHDHLEKYCIAQMEVKLKVGAQVMLIKNVEAGVLVNGSVGKVIDFLTVREARSRGIGITIPSSGNPEAEEKKILKKLAENRRHPYSEDPSVIRELYENLPDLINRPVGLVPITDHTFRHDDEWPLVSFTNGRELLCAPLNFEQVGLTGNIEAHRMQVPLILAWAISMHKSQGQTLQHVKVDFRNIFEHGQAYVALSRATSMEGLQIAHFNPSKITAHPIVTQWHNEWQTKIKFIECEKKLLEFEPNDHDDYEEAANLFWGR